MNADASNSLFAGLDLHSNNVFAAIKDGGGACRWRQRLPNQLPAILQALEPFRASLAAVAVESTYNWYWLVDGLMKAGFAVRLANPAALAQYSGLKQTDDASDALWLAELLRLGILPQGYIYPKEMRPVRDMLRRRSLLVRQATQSLVSLQSMVTRQCGVSVSGAKLQRWHVPELRAAFPDEVSQQTATALLELFSEQHRLARSLEKSVLERLKPYGPYQRLLSLPGVGEVLALTIALETGPIQRFGSAGEYASYARSVPSRCESNGVKKGENNRKNGNKYLAWAFVEAANFAQRYNAKAKSWCARKAARTGRVVAIKALAGKLAKAAYFVMRDEVEFQEAKMFG
jgi:transposase